MIDRKHRLSVTRQAQLLGLSRGAVYYLPQPVGAADLALMRRLDELHLKHPFMGARMLRRQLKSEGIQVGRRHVRTLMLRMGMEALCPQPGTSKRHPDHQIYPYLLRQLAITRANQVWALDTTYIPMARGVCLPHRLGGCGQSPGAGAQGGHHAGGVPCQRDYRAGLCALWGARDRQHRSG